MGAEVGVEVATAVYRSVVSYAELGLEVSRVVLPVALFEAICASDKAWLFEHAGVTVEVGELTEPVFVFK